MTRSLLDSKERMGDLTRATYLSAASSEALLTPLPIDLPTLETTFKALSPKVDSAGCADIS